MSTDQFVLREKALEEEFFAKESAKLKEALQSELRDEQASAALEKASGIADETVLHHMLAAGLSPQTGAAFALLPLILTAWADGKLDSEEKTAVLTAARDESGITEDSPAYEMLQHWLSKPPPRNLWRVWREYANALAQTLDADARQAFTDSVIGRAERVAAASGGILGLGKRISKPERKMLDELAAALQ
ncbi:MAG: hypothetical protein OET44_03105 [Gammaproteobacteria bacterium]|nr:hypothetical protein [Gammaproteobacteria bacterium]